MVPLELKQIKQVRQIPGLVNKIELVKLLQLSEKEFAELIKDIEDNPLFKKLAYYGDSNWNVINRKKFPKTDVSEKFYELKEEISGEKSSFNIESLLEKRKECISIIKKLDESKFREYFLYNEPIRPLEEIAGRCLLTVEEVKKVFDLIDEVSIYSDLYNPSALDPGLRIHYNKVASIEKDDSGNFTINFFSPYFVRGKYKIDYDKLAELKNKKAFSPEELKQLNKLLHKLKLINDRKSTIYQIIQEMIEVQNRYFLSEEENDLISFRQKDLAKKIDADSGLICRVIAGRSIVMPWGEEKPIKYFFSTRKKILKNLIKNVILDEENNLNDENIKAKIQNKYGIEISRRSIAEYRHELKIPSSFKRK